MNFYKLSMTVIGAVLMLSMASQTYAIQRAETMLRVGQWRVLRVITTEQNIASTCFAVYEKDAGIQMWAIGLFMKFHEPVDQVDLAFGSGPFLGLRPASLMEKKFNLVRLADEEFKGFLDSTEVRVRVLTESKQKLSAVLEASGAREAHTYILAGCPGNQSSLAPTGCDSGVERTLRSNEIAEDEIAELCGKPDA